MDIIEFAEKKLGIELYEWQKECLRRSTDENFRWTYMNYPRACGKDISAHVLRLYLISEMYNEVNNEDT